MTTRTVAWALTWEYWRRGAIWLVPVVAGLVIACTGSLYGLLLHVTRLHYSDLRAELDVGLLAFVILPPVVLTVASFGASRRYHVLPIPTALFVGCTLANGALAAMLTYGLVALVLGRWLDADWPLLGPACWAATAYVVLQSLAWQAGRSRGLFVVVMGLFLGFVMPLAAEYLLPCLLPPDDQVVRSGLRPIPEMLLALVSAWVLAYFLAVSGVARDRRGDAWSLAWLARVARWPMEFAPRLTKRTISQDRPARAFRSPQAAQFWFEWHAKGRVIWLSFLALLGGFWAWLTIAQPNPIDIDDVLGGLGGMCVVLTPFVGLYLGSDAGRFDRRVFSATRPLSDGDMASAVLRNVAAVVGSCSAIWLLGIIVALAVFHPHGGEWQQIQHAWANDRLSLVRMVVAPTVDLLLRVLWLLLGIWTVVGLSAALAMARSWFVCVGGIVLLGQFVSLLFLAKNELYPSSVLAVVCLLGTLTAYTAAYLLRVISPRTIITYGALYLLLCIVSISAYAMTLSEGRLPVHVYCALAGVCAAPFAPLAMASCALSWNRHR